MPAIRTARPDVILRVPRAIHVSKAAENSSGHDGNVSFTEGGGSGNSLQARSFAHETGGPSSYRRSASPVKGGSSNRTAAIHDVELRDTVGGSLRSTDGTAAEATAAKSSYQYAAQATSTAEWNSLLIWARGQRGPQWDSATGMWQVDQGSNEYYAFANDPARHTNLSNNRRVGGGGLHDVGSGNAPTSAAHMDTDRKPFVSAASGAGVGGNGSAGGLPQSSLGDAGVGSESGTLSSTIPSSGIAGSGNNAAPFSEDSPPVGPGGRRSRAR